MRPTINSGPCPRHRILTRRYVLRLLCRVSNLINCGADVDHYANRRRALKIGLGKKISRARSTMAAVHISYVETFGNMGKFLSFLSLIISLFLFFFLQIKFCTPFEQ